MYIINSGEIQPNVLYLVNGYQSAIYNSVTYSFAQYFRGLAGVSAFTHSGTGTQSVTEVLELRGNCIEYVEVSNDQPLYNETTTLKGFAIEYELNEAEKIVLEVTKLKGGSIELIDHPFYCFEITETKL